MFNFRDIYIVNLEGSCYAFSGTVDSRIRYFVWYKIRAAKYSTLALSFYCNKEISENNGDKSLIQIFMGFKNTKKNSYALKQTCILHFRSIIINSLKWL